ncbi:MAG: endolytic transglycosylase MltG [Thermodesulfobacteria bacterium]|nr:endolytic transglycosylase MltG [Thermodesulfobacteriota bacterium]
MKFSSEKVKKLSWKKFFVIGFVCLYLTAWYVDALSPVSEHYTQKYRVIEIQRGENIWDVAKKLEKAGLIKSALAFTIYAVLNGDYKRIKAGEYGFYLSQSPKEILSMLVKGKVLNRKVVIPEGMTIWEIGEALEKAGICSKKEFLKLATDPSVARKYGLPGPTLEGYLFPDTYYFPKNTHPGVVIQTMVENFWKHWKKFAPIAKKEGKSLKEVITLASIVEKEALFNREKPIIAAVYLNRLKRGMPLQADPTINYALKSFKPISPKDYYTVKSPYNTYLNKGLPPTPICNPGEASIKAVLFPAKVRYLYFVAKGDGTHYFSLTYRQHLRAIRRIRARRRWLRRIRYRRYYRRHHKRYYRHHRRHYRHRKTKYHKKHYHQYKQKKSHNLEKKSTPKFHEV